MGAAAPIVTASSLQPSAAGPSLYLIIDPGLSRFAWVLMAYVVGLAAIATLSPFDFDFAHPHGAIWETTGSDVALNLAFLFPVGFLLRLARARNRRSWPAGLDALSFGLGLSLLLELTQTCLPSRCTSPTDVITNGLGAWAGGLTHASVGPWLDRRLHQQLSLHLPLANIMYLLLPLLALNGLAGAGPSEILTLVSLALFTAFIAAGLYKHRLEGSERPFTVYYSLIIGAVFGVGCLPLCSASLPLWAACVFGMAALTRLIIAIGTRLPKTERRFVPRTIQRALPWFIVYLLSLGLHWLPWGADAPQDALEGEQVNAMALLRDVASFTLLGYLCSELEARSAAKTWIILTRGVAIAAAFAACVATLRLGARANWRDGLSEIARLIGAALAGGIIHRSQLRLVQSWGRTAPPRAPSAFSKT